MLSFLIGIICILLHRPKKITLIQEVWDYVKKYEAYVCLCKIAYFQSFIQQLWSMNSNQILLRYIDLEYLNSYILIL